MLTFAYDQTESPAAPFIELELVPTGPSPQFVTCQGKLDSGAGITVIPKSLVVQWNLVSRGTIRVRGYDGQVSQRPIYRVNVVIGSRSFPAVEVTASPRTHLLVGRDLMNELRILLDGPQQTVKILDA